MGREEEEWGGEENCNRTCNRVLICQENNCIDQSRSENSSAESINNCVCATRYNYDFNYQLGIREEEKMPQIFMIQDSPTLTNLSCLPKVEEGRGRDEEEKINIVCDDLNSR